MLWEQWRDFRSGPLPHTCIGSFTQKALLLPFEEPVVRSVNSKGGPVGLINTFITLASQFNLPRSKRTAASQSRDVNEKELPTRQLVSQMKCWGVTNLRITFSWVDFLQPSACTTNLTKSVLAFLVLKRKRSPNDAAIQVFATWPITTRPDTPPIKK
jgi:hypothetical protein